MIKLVNIILYILFFNYIYLMKYLKKIDIFGVNYKH